MQAWVRRMGARTLTVYIRWNWVDSMGPRSESPRRLSPAMPALLIRMSITKLPSELEKLFFAVETISGAASAGLERSARIGRHFVECFEESSAQSDSVGMAEEGEV